MSYKYLFANFVVCIDADGSYKNLFYLSSHPPSQQLYVSTPEYNSGVGSYQSSSSSNTLLSAATSRYVRQLSISFSFILMILNHTWLAFSSPPSRRSDCSMSDSHQRNSPLNFGRSSHNSPVSNNSVQSSSCRYIIRNKKPQSKGTCKT